MVKLTEHNVPVLQIIAAYMIRGNKQASLASMPDVDVEYLYDTGLAPATYAICQPEQGKFSAEIDRKLSAADLTARVVYRELAAATETLLDLAAEHDISVVLLKGMAVAEKLYIEPHHRTMGDIDVLTAPEHAPQIYQALVDNGFASQTDVSSKPDHHHLPALYDPDSNVAVEVHHALFSSNEFSDTDVFRRRHVWRYAINSSFHGRRCLILRPELQLLYTLGHWSLDQKWTVNPLSIMDIVLMLSAHEEQFDWNLIMEWLAQSDRLIESFAVLMTFLDDAHLAKIPQELAADIHDTCLQIGENNLKVLHWLLLKFPLSGHHRAGFVITRKNARLLWQTLLGAKRNSYRLPSAIYKMLTYRPADQTLLESTFTRLRTLFRG